MTVEEKLDTAKAELKECYDLFKEGSTTIISLQNSVTALNSERHDGSPMAIIAAYANAFSSCDEAGKLLIKLRNKMDKEADLWLKL